jgi:hypothetical protein
MSSTQEGKNSSPTDEYNSAIGISDRQRSSSECVERITALVKLVKKLRNGQFIVRGDISDDFKVQKTKYAANLVFHV